MNPLDLVAARLETDAALQEFTTALADDAVTIEDIDAMIAEVADVVEG